MKTTSVFHIQDINKELLKSENLEVEIQTEYFNATVQILNSPITQWEFGIIYLKNITLNHADIWINEWMWFNGN